MQVPTSSSSPTPIREMSTSQVNEKKILDAFENTSTRQLSQPRRPSSEAPTEKPPLRSPIQRPIPKEMQALANRQFGEALKSGINPTLQRPSMPPRELQPASLQRGPHTASTTGATHASPARPQQTTPSLSEKKTTAGGPQPPSRPSTQAPSLEGRREIINTIFNDAIQGKGLDKKQEGDTKNQIVKEAVKFAQKEDAGGGHLIQIHEQTYMVAKSLPGGPPSDLPAIWKKGQQLNEGTFKVVSAGEYIGKVGAGRKDVLKQGQVNQGEKANKDLEDEFRIAHDVHRDGLVEGIAPPPHSISYGQTVGYLESEQKMDGFDFANERGDALYDQPVSNMNAQELKNWQNENEQLVDTLGSGLNSFHEKGYYHGDVKTENLLWDGNKLLLADLGGAKKFGELVPLNKFPTTFEIFYPFTPGYVSKSTHDQVQTFLNRSNEVYEKESDPAKKEQIIKNMFGELEFLLRANDKFALGTALYMSLTGEEAPYMAQQSIPERTGVFASKVESADIQEMRKAMEYFRLSPDTITSVLMMVTSNASSPYLA